MNTSLAPRKATIVISGGSRGIGAATAVMAAGRGYPVAILYRHRSADAEAVVRRIEDAGGQAMAIRADVGSQGDVESAFDATRRRLGDIGALVNNAGVTGGVSYVSDVTEEQLSVLLGVNVTGAFLCARAAVRRMATDLGFGGGSIVNVSSRAALLGAPGVWVHYAATKGAVDTMTIGLAKELAPRGVRVNAVRPGLIDTEIHSARTEGSLETMVSAVPMKRMGRCEEVAAAILWLMSDEASYVTGAIVDVAGGA